MAVCKQTQNLTWTKHEIEPSIPVLVTVQIYNFYTVKVYKNKIERGKNQLIKKIFIKKHAMSTL